MNHLLGFFKIVLHFQVRKLEEDLEREREEEALREANLEADRETKRKRKLQEKEEAERLGILQKDLADDEKERYGICFIFINFHLIFFNKLHKTIDHEIKSQRVSRFLKGEIDFLRNGIQGNQTFLNSRMEYLKGGTKSEGVQLIFLYKFLKFFFHKTSQNKKLEIGICNTCW